jgi:hypothetical protein
VGQSAFHQLGTRPPSISVLSDGALLPSEVSTDQFELVDRIGPIFDIIRHPETRPPMAIALYGDWGAGKSSAMRWLDGLLRHWTQEGVQKLSSKEAGKKIKVRTVWFYPWKYQSKDDVWRGLISEIILESINVEGATPARALTALREFGAFLGKSFVRAVSKVKLTGRVRVGDPKVAQAEFGADVDLASVQEIVSEFEKINEPQKGFLNDFEETLRDWVTKTIGPNERLCVFIDDLDRCMPEVGLQVLEALKLYLNIDRLIFVVGVDRAVVSQLVEKHYDAHGLSREKSRHYLAKMFQIEVFVGPTERQMRQFLKARLENLSLWRENLSEDARAIFERVVFNLAEQNPREIKRTLNGALIASSSAIIRAEAKHLADDSFSFEQRLQIHLIDLVLQTRHPTLARFRLRTLGDEFFGEWSTVIRALVDSAPGGAVNDSELVLDRIEALQSALNSDFSKATSPIETQSAAMLSVPAHFKELVGKRRFLPLIPLLGDSDLASLLKLSYPRIASALVELTPSVTEASLAADTLKRATSIDPVLDDAIRSELKLARTVELTLDHLEAVRRLDLRGKKLKHFPKGLSNCIALESLDLSANAIEMIPVDVVQLDALKTLSLRANRLVEVPESIFHLFELSMVDLSSNRITGFSLDDDDFAGVSIVTLNLANNPLRRLPKILSRFGVMKLDLSRTQIDDSELETIRGMPMLGELRLIGCPRLSEDCVAAFVRDYPDVNVIAG